MIDNDLYYKQLVKQNKLYGGPLVYIETKYKFTPSEFVKEFGENTLVDLVRKSLEDGHPKNRNYQGKAWSSWDIDDFFENRELYRRNKFYTRILSPGAESEEDFLGWFN